MKTNIQAGWRGWAGYCAAGGRALLLGVLLAVLGAGCATTAMKGTPFYTGEYSKREGPPEDRVNLWPAFYYRPPGLSAFWPIFEKSDEHLAIRPVFSLYGADPARRQFNVLWPLTQFDLGTRDYRIVPFFWGGGAQPADDYRVAFPLYWHFGHPQDDAVGGLDTLFPLWWVDRQGTNQSSVYCPWPLIHWMREGREAGWYVFPLAGSYHDDRSYFNFQAAFLADQWGGADPARHGSLVLPLYFYERNSNAWTFCSLPWSGGRDADTAWQCWALLAYHRTNTTGALTLSPLWLSQRPADPQATAWQALLPVFYHSGNKDSDVLLTPLLMQGTSADPTQGNWTLLLPLFYHSSSTRGSTTLSPLWLSQKPADPRATAWEALLPVYYRGRSPGADLLLTPLWSQGAASNANWQLLLPLYYARQDGADSFWATPLGGLRTAAGAQTWMIYPLLSWGTQQPDGGSIWALAPLVHAEWDRTHAQSHVMPFYYYRSDTHTFLSPLWARWAGGGHTNALVPPLLSWVSTDAAGSDLWLALGLGKFSWGAQPGAQYLIPFFYQDRATHTFLSPLWAGWQDHQGRLAVVPPLLTWKTTRPQRSDLHVLLALGQFSWGEKPGAQYLLPVFYQDRAAATFLSPLWARWAEGGRTNALVPPLLSWVSAGAARRDLWLALGLGRFGWGDQPAESHLLPLYYHDPRTHEFYTLLYGQHPGPAGFTYFATPLAGVRQGAHTGSWLFPLYSHRRDAQDGAVNDWFLWGNHWAHDGVSRTVFFPLFGYHNFGDRAALPAAVGQPVQRGTDFFCLPFCWYRNATTAYPAGPNPRPAATPAAAAPQPSRTEHKLEHGVFPLWSYASLEKPGEGVANTDGSFLLWLYDYKHELTSPARASGGTNDYARTRVLWHLWHYERLNGDVSVDLFPGITYDRKPDGYKKITWLWRFFRYERDPAGGRKLDLLFIPVLRSGAATTERRASGPRPQTIDRGPPAAGL